MDEDFKRWLYKKAGYDYNKCVSPCLEPEKPEGAIEILIKAMWAINREGKCYIKDDTCACEDNKGFVAFIKKEYGSTDFKRFFVKNNNNSEQETLQKALEYIFKQEKNK